MTETQDKARALRPRQPSGISHQGPRKRGRESTLKRGKREAGRMRSNCLPLGTKGSPLWASKNKAFEWWVTEQSESLNLSYSIVGMSGTQGLGHSYIKEVSLKLKHPVPAWSGRTSFSACRVFLVCMNRAYLWANNSRPAVGNQTKPYVCPRVVLKTLCSSSLKKWG